MSDYELKRINALPEASAINDSDVFAIDSAAGTKKVAWETLKGEVDADISEAVSNKADTDGTYPDMAVGSVLGTNTVTDNEPYFIRPSASIGDREFDTLVGGTLGWNQLVQNGDFADTSNWTVQVYSLSAANNVLTVTIPETHTAHFQLYQSGLFATVGHKYLICANVKPSFAVASFQLRININDIATEQSLTASVWNSFEKIFSASEGNAIPFMFRIEVSELQTGTVDFKIVNLIDLTTLFGSTIADYIYSLEQATAGAGVAWFRQYFGADYYPYSAPTLKSVEGLTAHEMVGFNAWDEEWEVGGINSATGEPATANDKMRSKNYCACFPSTAYYGKWGAKVYGSDLYAWFYDDNKAFISGTNIGNREFTTPSNAHYFKISTYGAGYVTYKNDICINLSDPQRNGEYEPYVKHSYPLDSTWIGRGVPKLDSSNKLYFDGDRYASDGTVTERFGIRAYQSGDESLADAITDGTNTVYKLTTPTTSSASPFTSPQICDPNGTEEYVTTGLVPVGHETEYVENLADKLTDIPDLPTTAGTYRLAVTVDGGTPSYAWVADE